MGEMLHFLPGLTMSLVEAFLRHCQVPMFIPDYHVRCQGVSRIPKQVVTVLVK